MFQLLILILILILTTIKLLLWGYKQVSNLFVILLLSWSNFYYRIYIIARRLLLIWRIILGLLLWRFWLILGLIKVISLIRIFNLKIRIIRNFYLLYLMNYSKLSIRNCWIRKNLTEVKNWPISSNFTLSSGIVPSFNAIMNALTMRDLMG